MSSTNYNPKFDLERFMALQTVKTGRGANAMVEQVIDVLDPRFLTIIDTLLPAHIHEYVQGESLPNIAYFYHNTTTTWRIIAAYNGIINWLSLQPGARIYIPGLSAIALAIHESSPGAIRSNVITI
jgi:hypothetical protein